MRALNRWEPSRGATTLQEQLGRLFSDVFERSAEENNLTAWAPAVDIFETEHELVVKADLPDIDPKDLGECGCHQGRLSEWRTDADHPQARGSQAQADQGERGDTSGGRGCFGKITRQLSCVMNRGWEAGQPLFLRQ